LWQLKNTHNSITIQNRTNIDIKLFDQKDLKSSPAVKVHKSQITLYTLTTLKNKKNHSCIHEENKRNFNSENACYHSSSHLLSKNVKNHLVQYRDPMYTVMNHQVTQNMVHFLTI
jgi:hypothetical protein